ncbi:hypothetical protein HDU82_002376, partial [Entophlyctis luteolus]
DRFVIGPEFDLFARAIQHAASNSAIDPYPDSYARENTETDDSLLQRYSRIVSEKLLHANTKFPDSNKTRLDSINETDDEIDSEFAEFLALEAATWSLVFTLLKIRVHTQDGQHAIPHAYASDQYLVSYLVRNEPSLAELIAVKGWLQNTAPEPFPTEQRKGYRPFTQKMMREQVARIGNPKHEFDPDAPVRTSIPLAPDDLSAFDPYERAVYGALAGSVDTVLPVCKTWEDYVWAHYNHYLDSVLDNHLAMFPQVFGPDDEEKNGQLTESTKLPAELFEWLSRNENARLSAAAQNPFRIIQAMIILDRVDPLLESIHQQLLQESASILQLPSVLRFVVHFILALRSVSYPMTSRDSANHIIKAFIVMLVAAQKNEIVTNYIAQLPATDQISVFAEFLNTINDHKEGRYAYIIQGKESGIDTHMACKQAVNIALSCGIFQEMVPMKANSVFVSNLDDEFDELTHKQVRSLEWLLFDPLQQADALAECNRLARRFLVHGKINVLKAVLDIVPDEKNFLKREWLKDGLNEASLGDIGDNSMIDKIDPSRRRNAALAFEFMAYKSLVAAFAQLVNWTSYLGIKPLQGFSSSDTLSSFQYREWVQTLK